MSDRVRSLRLALEDWQAAGLTHLPLVSLPQIAVRPAPSATVEPDLADTASEGLADSMPRAKSSSVRTTVRTPTAAPTNAVPDPAAQLAVLAEKVSGCTRCSELAATRTQTVFGVGNPRAQVMFVGEAPGADEDATGEPFVGRAGQLLNKIIAACGWTREELYICNILRCRPPGNRAPAPQEAVNCREYLDGQIAIVGPRYIVCWGTSAAQNLLGSTETIGKLRNQWFEHGDAKVLCTYHPSYLLRNPAAKKPVWEDMQVLLKDMGLTPPARGAGAGM